MNRKYVIAGLIGLIAIVGWNVFLTQRDENLFKAYYKETAKQEYCKQQAGSHPDCSVK